MKQNCWEKKGCGREEGGSRAEEEGICPVSTEVQFDGVHGGKNGGRCCWVIAGTFCHGEPQGTYVSKIGSCLECDFYQQVLKEEGKGFHFVLHTVDRTS